MEGRIQPHQFPEGGEPTNVGTGFDGSPGLAQFNSHIALRIPEILAKIFHYLSLKDLTACSYVCSVWGMESRPLVFGGRSNAKLWKRDRIVNYLKTMEPFDRCHQQVTLHLQPIQEGEILEFAISKGSKVRKLELIWIMDASRFNEERSLSADFIQNFTNLSTLKLEFHYGLNNSITMTSLGNLLPQGIVLSTVRKVHVTLVETTDVILTTQHLKNRLLCKIMDLCPNLTSLLLDGQAEQFLDEMAKNPDRFVGLTGLEIAGTGIDNPIPAINRSPFSLIKKLCLLDEFAGSWASALLAHVAPTLEVLHLKRITTSSGEPTVDFTIPLMPHLKRLKISIALFYDFFPPLRTKLLLPKYWFNFASANEHFDIQHSKQWPCLESLIIKTDEKKERRREESFEVVAYMFKMFFPPSCPPCTTIRHLDIELPISNEYRAPNMMGTGHRWINSTLFYQKLVQQFPNVNYYWLQPHRELYNQEQAEKFFNLGEMLEIFCNLTDDYIKQQLRKLNEKISCLLQE